MWNAGNLNQILEGPLYCIIMLLRYTLWVPVVKWRQRKLPTKRISYLWPSFTFKKKIKIKISLSWPLVVLRSDQYAFGSTAVFISPFSPLGWECGRNGEGGRLKSATPSDLWRDEAGRKSQCDARERRSCAPVWVGFRV